MSCKQLLTGMVNSLLPLLAFSQMACGQQSSMPPKTEDRPLPRSKRTAGWPSSTILRTAHISEAEQAGFNFIKDFR